MLELAAVLVVVRWYCAAATQCLVLAFRAIPSYDEMPRTAWIFKYSAQNTVTVSRTFFTQEVAEAFDELEEGNEEAMKGCYDRQV